MKPFTALLGAAAGTHAADQLALATLPLTATLVLGAGPDILGLLVAAQSAAWLLVTLPAGAWADRMSRRTLLIIGLALGLAASVVAVIAAAAGITGLLGIAAFIGASGTVVYMLTSMSLLPSLVPAADLPRSNARLELARAIVSLAAPFVAGLLAQHLSPTWGYALAALGAAVALACIIALPKAAAPTGDQRPSMAAAIQAGARFVVRHELLRGISLCAIFWNFAFFALLAVWAPLALNLLKLDPASMGLAQSAYGAGLILGALVAPISSKRLPPLATLIFGPAVSVIAAALFLMAPSGNGFAFAAAGHFLVGFGPMLWLICQTTVRQLVTPAPMLGRVNATVQTAIYGVRPLGALAGGMVAAHAGLQAALLLIAVSFVLSTLVIVLSPLARLRALPQPVAA
ncbi:MFS transporter [Reyranella soli]|uniref:MFS transporter n=1 Tax=Reyranella soli TaxID=1230389 RepID=A0A512NJ49_9HYPH|nr:MFS transporter [Reyranella soli]GEP58966.1 MFS transporter [Reyranella soli]